MDSKSKANSKVVKPRSGLKVKTRKCGSCKLERPVWKIQENQEPLCKECSSRISAKKEKQVKSTKPKKDKAVPISKLIKLLDEVFSQFIRLRDSDENGYCSCVTCGAVGFWKGGSGVAIQNGHFQSRSKHYTRHLEKNCSAQCYACNCMKQGEQFLHGIALDKRWGEGTALEMLQLGNQPFKYTREWLEERIKHYKLEVQRLKTEKGLN